VISAEASESAPGLWGDPIDDPGLERFVRLGGSLFSISLPDSDPIICIPVTVREVGIMDVEVGLVARFLGRVRRLNAEEERRGVCDD